MRPAGRLFEIITALRAAKGPMTGATLAARLEVSLRSIYRDIATLQAMRVPIDGARGLGYVLRPGFDLPPLMFTAEEAEALMLGLGMLDRLGDPGLGRQAQSARDKITAVLPQAARGAGAGLYAWQDPLMPGDPLPALIRQSIREERKLRLTYRSKEGAPSDRVIRPIALAYFSRWLTLTGWCELRCDFRSFRMERIETADLMPDRFTGQGDRLRAAWMAEWKRPGDARPA